jgi:hypothetical protein
MFSRFLLGALVGGIAVYVWGEDMRRLIEGRGRDVRTAAADAIHSVQSTAEGLFDAARDQVSATLEAGQEAVRPTRISRERR